MGSRKRLIEEEVETESKMGNFFLAPVFVVLRRILIELAIRKGGKT